MILFVHLKIVFSFKLVVKEKSGNERFNQATKKASVH